MVMNNNFDIAFLGGLFPKEIKEEILNNSIGSIQNAADALQWNFVNGLDIVNNEPVKLINSLYIGSFPTRYKKLFIPTFAFSHSAGAKDINVGFLNIFGLKHFIRYYKLKPYLKAFAKQNNGKDKIVIGYALTAPFIKCLKFIKTVNPSINTCIIVPDLPEFMNTSNKVSVFYNFFKSLEIRSIKRNLKYVDYYVLLTKYMKDALHICKPNVVIEGIATDEFPTHDITSAGNNIKTILYAGTLHEKYGVMQLVEAFENIQNEDYRLILCGEGDSSDKIIEMSKKDKRIDYRGQLPHKQILTLMQLATVLVNPRKNNEEYTRYSFPSKILEYFSSGTPVVAYKLDGIPEEYYDYMYVVNDDSIDELSRTLIEILEKPNEELSKKGKIAKKFVLQEKNNVVQARKIIDLIGQEKQ